MGIAFVLGTIGGGAGIRTRVHEPLPKSIYMLSLPFKSHSDAR